MAVEQKRQRKSTHRQSAYNSVPRSEQPLPRPVQVDDLPTSGRLRFRFRLDRRNRRPDNKAITSSSDCLDEDGLFRRFAQRVAQPLDGSIQAMIEIDEGVRRPELAAQFLSGDKFSRAFKQRRQHLKRLFLELYLLSPLAEFPGVEIHLERAETNDSR